MSNVAELNIAITAGAAAATQTFNSVVAGANKMGSAVQGVGSRMGGFATSMAGMIIGATGLGSAIAATVSAVSGAAEDEMAVAAFEGILGSAEKAQAMVSKIEDFSLGNNIDTDKWMNLGVALEGLNRGGEDLESTFTMLGDIATGAKMPIEELQTGFLKMLQTGEVTGKTLNPMIAAGVPIIGALAKQLGVAEDKVMDMVKDGTVGVGAVEAAMADLTSGTGIYAGAMDRAAKTTGGRWTTLTKTIGETMEDLGAGIIAGLDLPGMIGGFTSVVTYFRANWVPGIVAGFTAVTTIASTIWNTVSSAVAGFVAYAWPMLERFWNLAVGAWNVISSVAVETWNWITSVVQSTFDFLAPIAAAWMSYMTTLWDTVASIAGFAWEWISSTAIAAWTAIEPYATWLFEVIGTGFQWIRDTAIGVFATAEFVMINWASVGELAVKSVLLGLVTFWGQTEYFFGTVLPELIGFASRNWYELGTDLVNITGTILTNLWTNFTSFFTELWAWIKSGGTAGFNFAFTPLTEGFKSAVTETLAIAPREIGALESELGAEVGALANKVGGNYQEFLAQKMGQFEGMKGASRDPNDVAYFIDEAKKNQYKPTGPMTGSGKSAGEKVEAPKALLAGTKEAFEAISAAKNRQLGGGDAAENTSKNTEEIARETGASRGLLEKLVDKIATPKIANGGY